MKPLQLCKGVLSEIAAQILTVFAVKAHAEVLALAIGEEQVRRCRGLLGVQVFQGAAEFQSVEDVRQGKGGGEDSQQDEDEE